MRVVVPLAGPDFVGPDGRLKALLELDGEPLLLAVLRSRSWADQVDPADHVFVLRDVPATREFAAGELQRWFPGSQVTFLGGPARGAALSAAAGVALAAGQDDSPLVVDLADIRYRCDSDPLRRFEDPGCGGVALVFPSDDPLYSYVATDADGRVVEAAEKRVISPHASAGTYLFRDAATYFGALSHALQNFDQQAHRGLLFVCPLFNGVLAGGRWVSAEQVTEVYDVKVQT